MARITDRRLLALVLALSLPLIGGYAISAWIAVNDQFAGILSATSTTQSDGRLESRQEHARAAQFTIIWNAIIFFAFGVFQAVILEREWWYIPVYLSSLTMASCLLSQFALIACVQWSLQASTLPSALPAAIFAGALAVLLLAESAALWIKFDSLTGARTSSAPAGVPDNLVASPASVQPARYVDGVTSPGSDNGLGVGNWQNVA